MSYMLEYSHHTLYEDNTFIFIHEKSPLKSILNRINWQWSNTLHIMLSTLIPKACIVHAVEDVQYVWMQFKDASEQTEKSCVYI